MFNQGGLSLEQAPPISVVLRFFVTGALFGVLAGLFLFFAGERIFDIQSQEAKIITHALALGVMASFMLGALFQMLPVIAGVVLQTPTKKAMFVHVGFALGVISLLGAFYSANPTLYLLAALLLGITLLYATAIMLLNLFKLQNHSSSSKGMLFALLGFTVAILLALYLVLALGGLHNADNYVLVKKAHYSFALFGWVALLIVSISFQVIEMFYVTPAYPKIISHYFTGTIFTLLLLKSIPFFNTKTNFITLFIALSFILYASFTIHRLYKRKRPTSDATVWLWRFAMGMLIVSMLMVIIGEFSNYSIVSEVSYLTFIYFALSVVFAMTYKIVPFLVWFHLSNQGYMKAPLMHDIIHPKRVKMHFYIHVGSFFVWILSLINPLFFDIASILVTISFGWLLYHLIFAIYLYRHIQKHSEKISW